MVKFYDTSTLLNLQSKAFNDFFYLSSISLKELENIKTSTTKDEETKWAARRLLHLLETHQGKYECIVYHTNLEKAITDFDFPLNNDSKIIIQAYKIKMGNPHLDLVFYTADLSCKIMAESIGLPAVYTEESKIDDYTGYLLKKMDEKELADFYADIIVTNTNPYHLKINQYLLIEYNDEIIDKYYWTGEEYKKVNFHKFDSKMFGKIFPKDEYQQLAFHSLQTNQITMLKGNAGTGKSCLAFGAMFDMLEQGKIDKIIVFCNTVATKGSAKLGFYPGSRTEKLLDSQIGNLLESKLGDRYIVEKMISDGQLILLPMSDIRGYDTSNMNAAIYISEAQNLDIELMRLALQRIGEDSVCIIDGDYSHQVDLSMYAGSHNGMRRASEVFRGHPFYGEITLQKIYRSKIAETAELM